jgi:hypothetical protein
MRSGLAQKSDRIDVIELKISRDDASQQLSRIAAEVRKVRGKQTTTGMRDSTTTRRQPV